MAGIMGFHASYVLHALTDGIFKGITFSDAIEARIKAKDIWRQPGQMVHRFNGSHLALGTLILEFEAFEQMREAMEHMERHVRVMVE
jgi:hypothetical protein